MERFWQAAAGVMVAVVIEIFLNRQGRDMGLVLSIGVCCMVLAVMAAYLEPVLELLEQLQEMGDLDSGMLEILLKATGIGLVAELASLICADAGNAALGRAIQILAAAAVLWLAIPLVTSLMALLRQILGEL
ncbi:MAG: hypothetical protein LUJ09_09535 [Firmicutes bacterium]|nr:hypothetical protein [Bacillota bacterium]